MALAAPPPDRDRMLDYMFGHKHPPPTAYPTIQSQRATEAMEAGDATKVMDLRQRCSTIIGFTEYRFPRYQPARHHRLIAEHLERVERREIEDRVGLQVLSVVVDRAQPMETVPERERHLRPRQ
jgi:hypothetical protein